MAFVFTAGGSVRGSSRRLSFRRRGGVDWRMVAFTALSAVLLIAMLGRPL